MPDVGQLKQECIHCMIVSGKNKCLGVIQTRRTFPSETNSPDTVIGIFSQMVCHPIINI